jgi:malate/lactate dehydrogenase
LVLHHLTHVQVTDTKTADLFKTNANVIRDLLEGVARFCPKAYVCIITNPVNSTLPIACKVLEQHGVFDPCKVFGVTTLDVVRASTFAAHALGVDDPKTYTVPVVGGHSGATILPLFSQSSPAVEFSREQLDAVTNRECCLLWLSGLVFLRGGRCTDCSSQVCNSGAMRLACNRTQMVIFLADIQPDRASQSRCRFRDDMHGVRRLQVSQKAPKLIPNHAADTRRFVEAILKAARGDEGITEAAYVYLPGIEGGEKIAKELGVQYFATKLDFGRNGAVRAHPIGVLSDYERRLLDAGLPGLKKNIEDGELAVSQR